MANFFYGLINPTVKWILRSPFHGLMSGNTLIVEFKGRKSGRSLSTPISYAIDGERVNCFTTKPSKWWLNLQDNAPVHLTIKRKRIAATANVETDTEDVVEAQKAFLRAVPRDAKFAGIRLDKNGEPREDDIRKHLPETVYLWFEPVDKVD